MHNIHVNVWEAMQIFEWCKFHWEQENKTELQWHIRRKASNSCNLCSSLKLQSTSRFFKYTYLAKWNSNFFIISTCLVSDRKVRGVSVQIKFTWVEEGRRKKTVYGQECVYQMCLTYYAWIADKCTLIWNMIRLETMCLHSGLWRDDSEIVEQGYCLLFPLIACTTWTLWYSFFLLGFMIRYPFMDANAFVFSDWNFWIWHSAKSALIRKVRTPV